MKKKIFPRPFKKTLPPPRQPARRCFTWNNGKRPFLKPSLWSSSIPAWPENSPVCFRPAVKALAVKSRKKNVPHGRQQLIRSPQSNVPRGTSFMQLRAHFAAPKKISLRGQGAPRLAPHGTCAGHALFRAAGSGLTRLAHYTPRPPVNMFPQKNLSCVPRTPALPLMPLPRREALQLLRPVPRGTAGAA